MRKVLLIMLLVVVGISAFSQSPSKTINMRPAYPIAVGEKTVDGVTYDNNGLCLHDIPQDSLPIYEIGHIYTQTVHYTQEGHGFYVKADSLHSHNVTYNYSIDSPPNGSIEFNKKTGRFKFFPAVDDNKSFVINFVATSDDNTISEDVEFRLMAKTISEVSAIESQGSMPSAEEYTIINVSDSDSVFFNNQERRVFSYSIAGKDIVFDNDVQNKVWGLSDREDIKELNIYAERLIIRSSLKFPQTDVTIYARDIIFDDKNDNISSINTSPMSVETVSNDAGKNGLNAGNITLYAKNFIGNNGKRLILNGGNGQNSNRNGTPGSGGNGGNVISNLNIINYCDFCPGRYGVKYDIDLSTVTAYGKKGEGGHFELNDNPCLYIHPHYVACVLRHAKDAFINDKPNASLKICNEYHALIEGYMNNPAWETCDERDAALLKDDLTEIEDILLRLNNCLDYFGNPIGWVPLLSFEVMLNNYNTEIDRAIPTLYMYYWLNHVDRTLEHMTEAAEAEADRVEGDLEEAQNKINDWVQNVPKLQDEMALVQLRINTLQEQLDILKSKLLAKAKHNVKKRNRINKAIGVCKAIANVISVCGPYGQAIGGAMNAVLSSGIIETVTGINYSQTMNTVGNQLCDTSFYDNIKQSLLNARESLGTNFTDFANSFESLFTTIKPFLTNVNNLSGLLSKGSVPKNEVEAEFERLKAQCVEFKYLETEINSLDQSKRAIDAAINDMLYKISTSLSSISSLAIRLDGLRRNAFTDNSKRDLYAIQYLEDMQQRAKSRLLKYHYYLRKAYEYRLLRPYVGEFNLTSMYDRFEALGMALGNVIDANAYSSLSAIFRDVISGMAEEIINEYSNNYPEQSAQITVVIPKEKLELINTSDGIKLNFHEMGIFAPDEENVRIVDLGIKYIESHVEGNVGYSGYMDLNMTHSGMSQFRKDGQIYWFNHMSKSTTSPHTWGIRYDAITQESTNIQPSAASASLLYSILNGNNVMLFSRPSAWADINLTKKVHTQGDADIVLDSLVLRLQYDFTRRPTRIRNIDITTSDGLMPFIACSEVDMNGRSNGSGSLYRSYSNSSSPVTFTATEKYENYYFTNWTNRAGNVVSNEKVLTVSRSTDQFYTANYEWRVPILNVPDTIRVPKGEGRFMVNITNVGSGDTPMDWFVSDSLSTWVHVDGIAEGVDNGSFAFKYDANLGETERVDSIEIFVPETDIMSKMIYVIQSAIAVYGDVNCDGSVSAADITALYNYLLNGDATYMSSSDVDDDGFVNANDITLIYNIILGGKAGALKNTE